MLVFIFIMTVRPGTNFLLIVFGNYNGSSIAVLPFFLCTMFLRLIAAVVYFVPLAVVNFNFFAYFLFFVMAFFVFDFNAMWFLDVFAFFFFDLSTFFAITVRRLAFFPIMRFTFFLLLSSAFVFIGRLTYFFVLVFALVFVFVFTMLLLLRRAFLFSNNFALGVFVGDTFSFVPCCKSSCINFDLLLPFFHFFLYRSVEGNFFTIVCCNRFALFFWFFDAYWNGNITTIFMRHILAFWYIDVFTFFFWDMFAFFATPVGAVGRCGRVVGRFTYFTIGHFTFFFFYISTLFLVCVFALSFSFIYTIVYVDHFTFGFSNRFALFFCIWNTFLSIKFAVFTAGASFKKFEKERIAAKCKGNQEENYLIDSNKKMANNYNATKY
jgi:hypothetical protein